MIRMQVVSTEYLVCWEDLMKQIYSLFVATYANLYWQVRTGWAGPAFYCFASPRGKAKCITHWLSNQRHLVHFIIDKYINRVKR